MPEELAGGAELVRRSVQATVIGHSDAGQDVLVVAERVGALLARLGITVITGGRGGVMEAASRGAATAGGTTVGIVPSAETSEANAWCTVVIPTGLGNARNILTVLAGDFVVAIGGGAGTLSEICFAWIHGRPILAVEGCGGWSDRIGAEMFGHRATSAIVSCADLSVLEREIVRICREKRLRRGWRGSRDGD